MNKIAPYYYYAVLDVSNDASFSEIKTAYRKKALKFHPDKCKDPQAAEKFKEINHAFHILSDLEKRSCYDHFGGIEPQEMSTALSKPAEEFCEGIVLGTISVLSHLAYIAVFGVPYGVGITSWIAATHLLTILQTAPSTIAEARELRNWSKCAGTLLAPIVLMTSTSFVVGYLIFNSGKTTIEYTRNKLETLGQYFTTQKPTSSSSEQIEDWVVLNDTGDSVQLLEPNLSQKDEIISDDDDWIVVDKENM